MSHATQSLCINLTRSIWHGEPRSVFQPKDFEYEVQNKHRATGSPLQPTRPNRSFFAIVGIISFRLRNPAENSLAAVVKCEEEQVFLCCLNPLDRIQSDSILSRIMKYFCMDDMLFSLKLIKTSRCKSTVVFARLIIYSTELDCIVFVYLRPGQRPPGARADGQQVSKGVRPSIHQGVRQ